VAPDVRERGSRMDNTAVAAISVPVAAVSIAAAARPPAQEGCTSQLDAERRAITSMVRSVA
jgi:hypothetical protein